MTPFQQECYNLILQISATPEFRAFGFAPATVLATIQVESAFNPRAYRYEPRLGEASYGLMQVLASTAKSMGLGDGPPTQMYDPETGIRIGMRYLHFGYNFLAKHFQRKPSLEEWSAGYNEGYGLAARHVPDPAYTHVWLAARAYWAAVGPNHRPGVGRSDGISVVIGKSHV